MSAGRTPEQRIIDATERWASTHPRPYKPSYFGTNHSPIRIAREAALGTGFGKEWILTWSRVAEEKGQAPHQVIEELAERQIKNLPSTRVGRIIRGLQRGVLNLADKAIYRSY